MAQALLHIRVLEGEGLVHQAGLRSPRGVAVQVTDETGRPVEGAAVSFRLPEEGASGTFAHGMRTDISVTGPDGRASMQEFSAGTLTGAFQIRITAVKGQIRAGTIVGQYVSEASSRPNVTGSRKRWIVLSAAIAGGGAAAAFGLSRREPLKPGQSPTLPAPPQIGLPTISIGKP